jgi:dipeptidase
MKKLFFVNLFLFLMASPFYSRACTNFLVTKKASADGSTMISYNADSHELYGELYYWPAQDWPAGSMLKIYDWDSGNFLGEIPQIAHTYNVVGNMNEWQVSVGETTFGGREEVLAPGGLIDYGSLIYISLQRSKTAREAIKVITDLVATYGYYSEGESFSIADANEVWILEMVGKKAGEKGALWVARMIPDGYVSGHANQARITTFPYQKKNNFDDPKQTTFNSADVIDYARKQAWFNGKDADFSFSDTYAPLTFEAARFCEARVWSIFRKINSDMDQYEQYAMGYDLNPQHRMPLWILPDHKITVKEMMEFLGDHYEGTKMDMTKDVGAGPYACPYRWRPLTWDVDSVEYFNERAVGTQQTGFTFVAQARSFLPREIGGIIWFGVDDAATTVYNPIYTCSTSVPKSYSRGYGNLMEWQSNSAFWVFNQVSNFAYTRYNAMYPEIKKEKDRLENKFIAFTPAIDQAAQVLLAQNHDLAVQYLTDYSVNTANNTVADWKNLYEYLFMRYMDGNIKSPNQGHQNPNLDQPGYSPDWYRLIIEKTGNALKAPANQGGH